MQQFCLAYSKNDPAGTLIAQNIKRLGLPSWASLHAFKEDIIYVDPEAVEEKNIIFLSKHQSAAGIKTLTVHSIGNFGKAEFGGEDRKLSGTLPNICGNYLCALNEKNSSQELIHQGFNVSLEATHHGPFTEKNCLFIEVGSSENEWSNELAAKIVAETVIETTMREQTLEKNEDKIVIGLGGGHYSPEFTKLSLRKNYCFGHICAKYALADLNEKLLSQMITKSKAQEIALDWKGLKEHKEKVLKLCSATGLKVERVQNLLK